MWKSFKVKIEPLTPEAFAPFGEVIESFEEAKPEIAKGGLRSAAYPVTADLSEAPAGLRNPKNAALRRAAAGALSPFTPTRVRLSIRACTSQQCFWSVL